MADIRKKNAAPPYLFYLILLLAFLAAAVLLLPVYREYRKKRMELDALQHTLAEKRNESAERTRDVNALKSSPEAVEKVAREKYRYCKDGETIYQYPQMQKDTH